MLKKLYNFWERRQRDPGEGINLRNEFLYTITRLKLAPITVEIRPGTTLGIGLPPPRLLFKRYL
jgi:hypothetical protein